MKTKKKFKSLLVWISGFDTACYLKEKKKPKLDYCQCKWQNGMFYIKTVAGFFFLLIRKYMGEVRGWIKWKVTTKKAKIRLWLNLVRRFLFSNAIICLLIHAWIKLWNWKNEKKKKKSKGSSHCQSNLLTIFGNSLLEIQFMSREFTHSEASDWIFFFWFIQQSNEIQYTWFPFKKTMFSLDFELDRWMMYS